MMFFAFVAIFALAAAQGGPGHHGPPPTDAELRDCGLTTDPTAHHEAVHKAMDTCHPNGHPTGPPPQGPHEMPAEMKLCLQQNMNPEDFSVAECIHSKRHN